MLFSGLSVFVFDGDRIGVVGPNGSGKTTLLRIMAGVETADVGERIVKKLVRVGYVPQDPVFVEGASVEDVLIHAAESSRVGNHAMSDGEVAARVAETIGRAGLAERLQIASTLSGGQKKRLAIASEIIKEPDVLLLDEPTNHLDVDGLEWLENLLNQAPFASVTVSHDRWFLQTVANRVVEVNRVWPEGILNVTGDYASFIEARAERSELQQRQQTTLANKVRREVEWLRRGPKARATKAQSRIDSAHRLQGELADVSARNVETKAQFDFSASNRRTKRLMTLTGVGGGIGGRTLFSGLEATLTPGICIGLVGENGSGKTTLLRVLAGDLEPALGTISSAPSLNVVKFDQLRESLDLGVPLQRALAPDGDSIMFQNQQIHVTAWAKRFAFRQDHLTTPVGALSGGEQARVLIANLVRQPADVLLLDEPTNDLDIDTLEVLEDSLSDFPGAIILVTHDRYLMSRLASEIWGLDGQGGLHKCADLAQWNEIRRSLRGTTQRESGQVKSRPRQKPKKALTYGEELELGRMEELIGQVEAERDRLHAIMEDPAIAADPVKLAKAYEDLQKAQSEVDRVYARWEELEAKSR